MPKLKKLDLITQHSRNPSSSKSRKTRMSHPRLSLHPSPPKFTTNTSSTHFISNPSSLDKKKKPKALAKKALKPKKKLQQPTQATIDSTVDGRWKQHLKLTFRSKKNHTKEISLHNSSLKCMEEMFEKSSRKPAESYTEMVSTFPKQKQNLPLLGERERVFLLDWMNYVASELMCRRNTYHLAVAFLDHYLDKEKIPGKIQALGAGAFLLAVKQEERGAETYVLNILAESGSGLSREQIIEAQSSIILGLGFKLNFSTIPFWCDYFSQKWDKFIKRYLESYQKVQLQAKNMLMLRSPEGQSYRYYREMMQLTDVMIMHPCHRKYSFSELSLAILYLVVRVETESLRSCQESKSVFEDFHRGFSRKATPIFNDPYNFNATFNEFVAQVCNFEITDIAAMIKWTGQFLNMGFTFDIDSRAYQQVRSDLIKSVNYEQFLRFANYSEHIRNYFLNSVV